jgi:hypothetical protein
MGKWVDKIGGTETCGLYEIILQRESSKMYMSVAECRTTKHFSLVEYLLQYWVACPTPKR